MGNTFALVDCNNFYASCEKLFRPDLKHSPVVVLSNNDGCVVARSKEAKALGIKMGVPIFQIEHEIRHYGIAVFSSNYALYADLSHRVMQTLESFAPSVEVYSIDEAFLDLSGLESCTPLVEYGQQIRQQIHQWIGIQVCVGIAPSKTLAKLANHAAKRYPATQGIVDLTDPLRQKKLLNITPVDDVWGVGRRISKRLHDFGIHSALDLANYPTATIRKHFSVVLERTVRELNGESCLAIEQIPPIKKQIVCSRSFGSKITELSAMEQAIASYVCRAAEKLRGEGQEAKVITVFIRTSPFQKNRPQYSQSITSSLIVPSNDTRDLLKCALPLLRKIWQQGYVYAKAGVMLADFYDSGTYQPGLFDDIQSRPRSKALMHTIDQINHKGIGQVFFASQGIKTNWSMKRDFLSPAVTTRWSELAKVR